LNIEAVEVRETMRMIDAFRIADLKIKMPDDWLRMLARTKEELSQWRMVEFRLEPR
jgi:hypothetical protein